MISKDDSSVSGGFNLVIVANGRPYFDGRDRAGYRMVWGEGINLLDNRWHQVVGMRNGSMWSLWVDGEMKNSLDAGNTSAMDNNINLILGNSIDYNYNPVGTYWFNGLMDEVRIYDRALSGSEIQELYAQPNAVPIPATVLLMATGLTGLAGLMKKWRIYQ